MRLVNGDLIKEAPGENTALFQEEAMLKKKLTRRELGLVAANIGVASFAGGLLVGGPSTRSAFAQAIMASLGRFGSANPQTFGIATKSWAKALGGNVEIKDLVIDSGAQVVTAIAAGSMDMCNVGSSPIVVGYANGVDMSMVYLEKVITDSEALAVRNGLGIGSLKDLKGRKIGTPFNTSVHFAALAALKSAGLKPTDVELINMKPDTIVAAWKRKDIDVAYIWRPVLDQCVSDNGTVLFETGQLQAQGTLVFDGIVVRNAFKKEHPDLVLAYLKEYADICTLYREKPDVVVAEMTKFLALSTEVAKAYVASFHSVTPQEMIKPGWMGKPGDKDTGVLKTLSDQAAFLKEQDQINTIPSSFEPLVDSSFLAKMV